MTTKEPTAVYKKILIKCR